MAYKKSVRITDAAADVLAAFSDATGEGMNWSGAINSMAEHVSAWLEEITPELTTCEWNALYCCYNGYMPHPNIDEEQRLLAWHISEGYQYDAQVTEFLGSKESAVEFIERVKNMTGGERLALIVKAKKFWRKAGDGDAEHE